MTDSKITVFMVDDEYLERNLLKRCIDWNALGMEIIGEASNADEGFELVDELKPDIIFTDIKMPGMDGIEFSKAIAQRHPTIKIVVLTAYNDFDYAQKSVKIGVSDFLLKPIDEDEVLSTVSKLKAIIESERKEKEEFEELKRQIYDNLPYLRERFLNELISDTLDDHTIREKLEFFNISLNSGTYQVAALAIIAANITKEESRLIQNFRVANYVKNYFKNLKEIIIFVDSSSRIILLNNNEGLDLYKICIRLKNKIASDIHYIVNIGIGNIKGKISDIKVSYSEATDALNYCTATSNNNIVMHYRDMQFTESKAWLSTGDVSTKLKFYLKSGLEEDVMNIIKDVFSDIDPESENALKLAHITALNIISVCYSVLLELNEDFGDIYLYEIESYNNIINMESTSDIIAYISAITKNTIKVVTKEQVSNINNLIDKVKNFIKENISDSNLSLSYVAKHFYLNPSYLSRTFKKETGTTFIKYLTNKRMEKAISLIKEKNMKSFEIANAVGIQDPNYFSSCFKKYTGLNASEYKKLINH